MPEVLKRLTDIISFLPGIGEKSALKLAFFLLKANPAFVKNFARELDKLHTSVRECQTCFALTDGEHTECAVCRDSARDAKTLCVVEDYIDFLSLERLGTYRGRYHVLGGAVSPVNGVLPKDLKIEELFARLKTSPADEIILALNTNLEGEATALYVKENLPAGAAVKISRLSRGLPNAGYIEYADEITLLNAFEGRH